MKNRSSVTALFPLLLGFAVWAACSSDTKTSRPGPTGPSSGGNTTGATSGGATGGAGGGLTSGGLPPGTGTGGGGSGGGTGGSGGLDGSTTRKPRVIDRTGGKLPPDIVTKITGGGPKGAMAFLYPYDQTVFPGGILPPLIQWKPAAAGAIEAVYIHISSKFLDYKEVFGPITAPQIELPKDAWDAAAEESQGAGDPTTVELTTMVGGVVAGPVTETWVFARGQMKNAVYYNTYNSARTLPPNGAVMRILPLAREPEVVKTVGGGLVPVGPCYSWHSLSANGQMLVAQRHQYPGGPYTSNSFDVTANPNADPPPLATASAGDEDWGFSAVYPDGSKLLTAAQPAPAGMFPALFPFAELNNPGMLGPRQAKMFDTRTGAAIPTTGLVVNAKMPAFSPDGKKVVFNDHDNGQGHSLAVMDFDSATNTFSNRVEIYRDAALYPGWPFFTPDGLEVVFSLGNGSDYATIQDPPTGLLVNRSNLYIVDLKFLTKRPLDLANGRGLAARDLDLNYYTTVSPVAAGGYFWVFFTSRRTYGNVMTQPETDPVTKKLWVAAVNIESDRGEFPSPPAGDPSHPAFYLPGQELSSGNIRAFATLTPCKQDGTTCTSGLDCCGGFCVNGVCKPSTPECSKVEDKCTTADDCCAFKPPLGCVGGRCTPPPIIK
jgi:WD40-like Beta Propeller Repeat